jgi:tryptophan synthase alpha chain
VHDITPAAARLTARLAQPIPAFGAYLPAGFPAPGLDIETLQMLSIAGADVLEIGLPYVFSDYVGDRIEGDLR